MHKDVVSLFSHVLIMYTVIHSSFAGSSYKYTDISCDAVGFLYSVYFVGTRILDKLLLQLANDQFCLPAYYFKLTSTSVTIHMQSY